MKQLEKAIKNQPDPVTGALGYVFDGDQIEECFKRIEIELGKFKKQLQDLIKNRPKKEDYKDDTLVWGYGYIDKLEEWFEKFKMLGGSITNET